MSVPSRRRGSSRWASISGQRKAREGEGKTGLPLLPPSAANGHGLTLLLLSRRSFSGVSWAYSRRPETIHEVRQWPCLGHSDPGAERGAGAVADGPGVQVVGVSGSARGRARPVVQAAAAAARRRQGRGPRLGLPERRAEAGRPARRRRHHRPRRRVPVPPVGLQPAPDGARDGRRRPRPPPLPGGPHRPRHLPPSTRATC